jgi:hypothetical protein
MHSFNPQKYRKTLISTLAVCKWQENNTGAVSAMPYSMRLFNIIVIVLTIGV